MRPCSVLWTPYRSRFQSTHPLRGATHVIQLPGNGRAISIHAPLAGCDTGREPVEISLQDFNPRTPCGVRPLAIATVPFSSLISIHAPLAGCDNCRCRGISVPRDFNPRTPCGVRLPVKQIGTAFNPDFNPRTPCGVRQERRQKPLFACQFQSTHPLRGATSRTASGRRSNTISIHAPLAGCDSICCMAYKASPPSKGGPIKK